MLELRKIEENDCIIWDMEAELQNPKEIDLTENVSWH